MSLEFEYDADKSASNQLKHGINFDDAKQLWDDPRLVELEARTEGESRFVVIGLIGKNHWSAVITFRNTRVRIISVRRARKEEIEIYEKS